eukprot:UN09027
MNYFLVCLLITIGYAQHPMTGFVMTPNAGCSNQNDQSIWGITLEECRDVCNDLSGCVSMEYWTNHWRASGPLLCSVSTTCALADTHIVSSSYELFFYEKTKEDNKTECILLQDGILAECQRILSYHSAAAAHAQIGMVDSVNNNNDTLTVFGLEFKDLFTILLLIINLTVMCYTHCKSQFKQNAYSAQFDPESD